VWGAGWWSGNSVGGAPARVAKLADAGGLNPPSTHVECGFKSRPGHYRPQGVTSEIAATCLGGSLFDEAESVVGGLS
jgi:hypothetical protein